MSPSYETTEEYQRLVKMLLTKIFFAAKYEVKRKKNPIKLIK